LMIRVVALGFDFFSFWINDDELQNVDVCRIDLRVKNFREHSALEREPDFRFERRGSSDGLFAGARPLRVTSGRAGRERLSV